MDKKKRKKKNLLLDPIKKRLLRKDNVAPAAQYIQQKKETKRSHKKFLGWHTWPIKRKRKKGNSKCGCKHGGK